ncbi:MAG: twin-arginine translocation signal domain-containing protein [Candidatus Hydrogenedentota bacterium]
MTQRITRRRFVQGIAAGAALAGLPMPRTAAAPMPIEDYKAARMEARNRRRRIIMNNDGNDVHHAEPGSPMTPEFFLSRRTTALLDSQVDSIFYCTGVFNYYMHPSEESELLVREGVPGRFLNALLAQGTDPLDTMIAFCRAHDREIFWSMRMNDTHDSGNPDLLCQWKRDHPEYLVGKKDTPVPYLFGCNRWSSVDYGLEPVRDKVYRILEDVCTRYDVDGIELDFFRHPVLFREQMIGKPITQEHRDKMTDLMRRIRAMTEQVGRERGKPILVGIRVPDSVGYLKALGIDLVPWLEADLLDVLVGGGYFHMTPWKDWAALGHKHNVPTYACLVSRRLRDGGQPEADTASKIWRGEALNAWEAGVDGIYTFNRFNPEDAIFRELGDPELLASLPHTDQQSFVADIWSRPERWLKDGDRFVKRPAS